jgi:hypothetical protein
MVGVLTVPSTIISLVGDNTNHRENYDSLKLNLRQGLFYLMLYFIGTDKLAKGPFAL